MLLATVVGENRFGRGIDIKLSYLDVVDAELPFRDKLLFAVIGGGGGMETVEEYCLPLRFINSCDEDDVSPRTEDTLLLEGEEFELVVKSHSSNAFRELLNDFRPRFSNKLPPLVWGIMDDDHDVEACDSGERVNPHISSPTPKDSLKSFDSVLRFVRE
jgi:hypothetical protein